MHQAPLSRQTANQIREHDPDKSIAEAAVEASGIRLRPILMTSFAFILGILPLVFASGAGEAGRHSLGTVVFGGMLVSTFLSLYLVPVLYTVIGSAGQRSADFFGNLTRPNEAAEERASE